MVGLNIEETSEEDLKDFQGIRVRDGAKIFLHPSFGVTLKEIREKITGDNFISKKSILWLEGQETRINDLDLDSTLVTSADSLEVGGEYKDQKYIEYVPLDPTEEGFDELDEVIKIRGFRLSVPDEFEDLNIISN